MVYPPRCLLCCVLLPAAAEEPLCAPCKKTYSPAGLLCPGCEQLCFAQRCTCGPNPPLQGLYALSWYQGEWRRMLHRLKFEGGRQLSRPLGSWLGKLLVREAGWPVEAVTPLPLHRSRERQRGYNQSELIARYAAREMKLPLALLLKKTRPTPAQAGLSRKKRHGNVAGAFTVSGRPFEPGRVLLIDDIYSTGATLREAARVLNERGCSVYAAVIAYNPRLY